MKQVQELTGWGMFWQSVKEERDAEVRDKCLRSIFEWNYRAISWAQWADQERRKRADWIAKMAAIAVRGSIPHWVPSADRYVEGL